ncbi:MAG: hypothetical protein L6416_10985 [Candidatus Omnitrophica bacterium]|nr:hypothetical protein [Candidatus Omnitrophota bacterium]
MKKLFRLIAFVLIQAFLVMDCAWCGVNLFTDNTTRASLLAPKVNMVEAPLQNIFTESQEKGTKISRRDFLLGAFGVAGLGKSEKKSAAATTQNLEGADEDAEHRKYISFLRGNLPQDLKQAVEAEDKHRKKIGGLWAIFQNNEEKKHQDEYEKWRKESIALLAKYPVYEDDAKKYYLVAIKNLSEWGMKADARLQFLIGDREHKVVFVDEKFKDDKKIIAEAIDREKQRKREGWQKDLSFLGKVVGGTLGSALLLGGGAWLWNRYKKDIRKRIGFYQANKAIDSAMAALKGVKFKGGILIKTKDYDIGLTHKFGIDGVQIKRNGNIVYEVYKKDDSAGEYNFLADKLLTALSKQLSGKAKQKKFLALISELSQDNRVSLAVIIWKIIPLNDRSDLSLEDILKEALFHDFDPEIYNFVIRELGKIAQSEEGKFYHLLTAFGTSVIVEQYKTEINTLTTLLAKASQSRYFNQNVGYVLSNSFIEICSSLEELKLTPENWQWLKTKISALLIASSSGTKESVNLGKLLLRLVEENPELRVELTPLIIMNAWREKGISGENPLLRSLGKFLSSLTPDQMDQLRENNVDGLMEVVETIRDNPASFLQTHIDNPLFRKFEEAFVKNDYLGISHEDKNYLFENYLTGSSYYYRNLFREYLRIYREDENKAKGTKIYSKENDILDLKEAIEKTCQELGFELDFIKNPENERLLNPARQRINQGVQKLFLEMLKDDKDENKQVFGMDYFEKWKHTLDLNDAYPTIKDILVNSTNKKLKDAVLAVLLYKIVYGDNSDFKSILEIFNPELISHVKIIKNVFIALDKSDFLIEPVLNGVFNRHFKEANGKVYGFIEQVLWSNLIPKDFKIQILNAAPEAIIAKALKINIKLARFIKDQRKDIENILGRLSEPAFKTQLNEIAYNLNREVTLHPAEMRIGEDQKNSLFEYLFSLENISQAKEIFDRFFRNNPERYKIEISSINELLKYLSIEDIKKIIRTIIEDPKQSLEEITNAVKQQLQGMPNADFIIRQAGWILSNLFVLQAKIEQLEPVSQGLSRQGKTVEDLISVLEEIDKAQKFPGLNLIAEGSNLSLLDILRFKLESISQEAKEDMLADGFQAIDALSIEKKDELFSELQTQFLGQPAGSQLRICLKVLFGITTDNTIILKIIDELKNGGNLTTLGGKALFIRYFLEENRYLLAENTVFYDYLENAVRLQDKKQQKEVFKQLRNLYQERKYAATKLSGEELKCFKEDINNLFQQITLSKITTQIPHIFYGILLRINSDTKTLNTFRQLIRSLNTNKNIHDQLATVKNKLYEQMVLLLTLNYDRSGELLAKLLEAIEQREGFPSPENSERFYDELMYYLEQYLKVIDTYKKSKDKLFPELINEIFESNSEAILNDLLSGKDINDAKIKDLSERLAMIDAEVLLARFKKFISIGNESVFLEKLRNYAANNPRFKWRDHQGRNIYNLIDIYLRSITDKEIYENILAALEAEIDGRFKQWKYESEDYKKTIDEIIDIEINKLSVKEQTALKKAFEQAQGETLYEKLHNLDGFAGLKSRIEKIKNWEKLLQYVITTEKGDKAAIEFTDDFYILFNIGNYRGSTACQSCTYGTNLSRGLTGYVVNGTNKAVVLLDENRNVITRRIVRLRILEDKDGNKQADIFVEESTQFGVREIDKLYAALDILSQKTGLPVAGSQYRPAVNDKVKEGAIEQYVFQLFRGRSEFDYSDCYGHSVPGTITAGLYQQTQPVVSTGLFDLLLKPMNTKTEQEIEEQYALEKVYKTEDAAEEEILRADIESNFDLRTAIFGKNDPSQAVISAESLPDVHMVKVDDPSEIQVKMLLESVSVKLEENLTINLELIEQAI